MDDEASETVEIEKSSAAGGPGGWSICGWGIDGVGRVDDGGPMVPGPVAYVFGLCGVISNSRGPTARERAIEAGLFFTARAGDIFRLNGDEFELLVDGRGYPSLELWKGGRR